MARQPKGFPARQAQLAVTRPGKAAFFAPDLLRRRWKVLALASASVLALLVLARITAGQPTPLDPEAVAITIIIAFAAGATGLGGGLVIVLIAVTGSLVLVGNLTDTAEIVSTTLSAALWAGVAVTAGLIAGQIRDRATRRETALKEALAHSQRTRKQLERIASFTPTFQRSGSPEEVANAICVTARLTFGTDGARLYAVKGGALELLALSPSSEQIKPGFELPMEEVPGLEQLFQERRPTFVQDLGAAPLGPQAGALRERLGIVSTVRLPLVVSGDITGLLALNWSHRVERPTEELLAVMQRFADQAAAAWESALRLLAQKRVDALYETLKVLVELAPTFHITGPREKVAQAACEAALATFNCTGAALYAVEQDRLILLERRPPVGVLQPGTTFPLTGEMMVARELRRHVPRFVQDVQGTFEILGPWPLEVIRQAHVCSALYVPLRFDKRGAQNLLVLSWDTLQQEPDRDFLAIVERFADHLALALTNAAAEELHARLEAGLLPPSKVEHPRLRIMTHYRPGEQRLRLGGDFIGSLPTDDGGLAFVIGDVSGHGPDAAALATTLRSTWKALALQNHTLEQIVQTMESVLLSEKREPNSFASSLVGYISSGGTTLTLINVGHPPPLLVSQQVTTLSAVPQLPLGFGSEQRRVSASFELPPYWILFCYTDGLTQTKAGRGSSDQATEEYLIRQLYTWRTLVPALANKSQAPNTDSADLETAVESLVNNMRRAAGGAFLDDVAVLVVASK